MKKPKFKTVAKMKSKGNSKPIDPKDPKIKVGEFTVKVVDYQFRQYPAKDSDKPHLTA